VVGSRTGFSSSISSPRVYWSGDDSGIHRRVKEMLCATRRFGCSAIETPGRLAA
jgi:hypothetical protein